MKKIYTIRDEKINGYAPAVYVYMSDGEILRDFMDMMKKDDNKFAQHPEDFSIWCLGTYCEHEGKINPIIPTKCVTKLIDIASQPQIDGKVYNLKN